MRNGTMASPDLLWLLIRKNHSFMVKQNGNSNRSVQFSSEPNNLYNLNTFKYSGLANKKTVSIPPTGEGLAITLATTKTKKGNKPAKSINRSVLRRDFRKMARAVVNQVAENGYRPDLKASALARLAAVHKSLRVIKSGGKKGRGSPKPGGKKGKKGRGSPKPRRFRFKKDSADWNSLDSWLLRWP